MALMLRKSVLPKNISFLKCIKGRPIASTSFRKNPAVLSNNAWKKVIRGYSRKQFERPEPSVRKMKLNPNTTRQSVVPRRSMSSPCISTRIPERFLTSLKNSRSMTMHTRPQLFQYRCYSRVCAAQALHAAGTCSCLPPPCDCPPKCIQYMTGYYYYPYGTWFCGPYHVTGTCTPCGGPVTTGGPCGPGGPCPGTPCGLPGIGPCKCGPCLPCCGCVLENGNTNNYTMSHPHCVPFASGVPGPFHGTVDMYGRFGSGLSSGGSFGYNMNGIQDPMNVFASHGVPGGFHNGPVDFSGQYTSPYTPYQASYPQQTFDPNMPMNPSQHNAYNQSCGPCFNVPIQPVEVEPFMMPENFPQSGFNTQPQPAPEVKQKSKCNAFPLYRNPEERKDSKGTSSPAECLTSAAYSYRTNPLSKSPKFQIPTPYKTRFEKPRP
ncbi:uncharacterized protein LOC123718139 isoform X1 [Pieris brassicae]|uniref:uncharacterized protein LOC123718139 isoform X1 n=1 Tax=Pieris brassicae TaxID=7116 RepID=UPI001E660C41|nr:uncharacterized protein LOC123718139 isoform X1 [Pieris brassicae]